MLDRLTETGYSGGNCWDRIFGRFLLRQAIREVLAETGNSGGAGWDNIFGRCWLRQDIREVLVRQDIREVLAETGNSGGAGWDRIFRRCWLRQDIREVLAETGSRSLYSLVMRIQIICTVQWWGSNNTPPEYPVSVLAHQATPCSWANYRKGVMSDSLIIASLVKHNNSPPSLTFLLQLIMWRV